jgi:methylmalonyl-CoA mutase
MSEKHKKLFSDFPPVSRSKWKELIIKDLNGGDYSKKMVWRSADGLETEPFYTAEDLESISFFQSAPTVFPYVRGNKTKDNDWEICQLINASDPKTANGKALELISKGVNSIEFKLDFLNEQEELDTLLEKIDPEKISIHFSGAHSYSILLELLKKHCETRNLNPKIIRGSFNFDSFAYYLLNGSYYNSCSDNMNELKCLMQDTAKLFPNMKVLTINGHHFHNAGASIIQELAFTLASAHEYFVQMLNLNMKPEEVLPLIRFSFATGSSYFPEIAKIRAARLLWGYITDQYVSGNEKLAQIEIHSVSSLWNKTIFDSYNNILRTTTETMSAILGGSNSIHTLPYDITWKPSDSFSEHIAMNIQHMLKDESHLDKVIDPAAGSYYIEMLTASIAQHSWDLFLEVEEKGGFMAAMENGFVKNTIDVTAQERYSLIAARKTSILGVNLYPNLHERMADKIMNPMPDQPAGNALKLFRGAQAFEEMRLATGNYIVNGGIRPKVYIAQYGKLAMRIARTQFITNFFGIVGFEIAEGPAINNIEWTVNQIREQKADIVAICSSDDEYGNVAPELTKAIKKADRDIIVIIAGNPTAFADLLKDAGVDDFIHVKTNALESLRIYQEKMGIQLS